MVLLKQKDFVLAKAEFLILAAHLYPFSTFLSGVFLAAGLFGFLIHFEAYYPIVKQYKEMLTVKEVIKRGSQ